MDIHLKQEIAEALEARALRETAASQSEVTPADLIRRGLWHVLRAEIPRLHRPCLQVKVPAGTRCLICKAESSDNKIPRNLCPLEKEDTQP